VDCRFETDQRCDGALDLLRGSTNVSQEFRAKAADHLAVDHAEALVYIAPSRVNLELTRERWPEIRFMPTRDHLAA
jgi:peptide subunit release factor RF-3